MLELCPLVSWNPAQRLTVDPASKKAQCDAKMRPVRTSMIRQQVAAMCLWSARLLHALIAPGFWAKASHHLNLETHLARRVSCVIAAFIDSDQENNLQH